MSEQKQNGSHGEKSDCGKHWDITPSAWSSRNAINGSNEDMAKSDAAIPCPHFPSGTAHRTRDSYSFSRTRQHDSRDEVRGGEDECRFPFFIGYSLLDIGYSSSINAASRSHCVSNIQYPTRNDQCSRNPATSEVSRPVVVTAARHLSHLQ